MHKKLKRRPGRDQAAHRDYELCPVSFWCFLNFEALWCTRIVRRNRLCLVHRLQRSRHAQYRSLRSVDRSYFLFTCVGNTVEHPFRSWSSVCWSSVLDWWSLLDLRICGLFVSDTQPLYLRREVRLATCPRMAFGGL